MHTTQELWQAALRDPVLAPQMQGVFPSDKILVVKTYLSGLISNTDPHDLPGTHFVAILLHPESVNFLPATDFLLKCMDWKIIFYEM